MQRSDGRIRTTHAGSLPRHPDVQGMIMAKHEGQSYNPDRLAQNVRHVVAEAVQLQVEARVDCVNDGELGKPGFLHYARERLAGIEVREPAPGTGPALPGINGRDAREFPEYFAQDVGRRQIGAGLGLKRLFCTGPLTYVGQAAVQADVVNLRAALDSHPVSEAFMTAVAPGSIEHWLGNEYYPSDEAFQFAIADAMHEEYKAIVNAGLILQIDDPGLADSWGMHPEMSVADYRKLAEMRVAALNHGLRDLPPDRVRFHMCWGSYHGPHKHDIPLIDIVDIILKIRAGAYSLEASNPRHEHEWQVWEKVKLPEDRILIPGVVTHACDFVEHPELVAQRLVRFAQLVGRERVIAGTDCGLGGRVGHPSIVWAKLQVMAEGAQLASQQLWG